MAATGAPWPGPSHSGPARTYRAPLTCQTPAGASRSFISSISTTPLVIEDSIHFTLLSHWGKQRLEEDRPCPKPHGVQIRNQNSNRVVWGSLHKPSPSVPLKKSSSTLACASPSLPPPAFLPSFRGHAANAGSRAGERGAGWRKEVNLRQGEDIQHKGQRRDRVTYHLKRWSFYST